MYKPIYNVVTEKIMGVGQENEATVKLVVRLRVI